jgi:hypothetical protein
MAITRVERPITAAAGELLLQAPGIKLVDDPGTHFDAPQIRGMTRLGADP